ncbi:MAG: hypothetical protein OXT69_03330 [Candidatus Poribacteria bacterium]|nr:hypothetical protein [Candidatus Poribacteria bacterium]
MKTTQRPLHRSALLVGAVLMAALAVAAALLFRADDPDPAEMESAQEPSVRETAMSESGKAPDATASGAQETEPGQEKKPPEPNSRPEIQTTRDDMPEIDRSGWIYDPSQSKKMNRIRKYLYDQYGSSDIHRKENGRTPRGVIEILVEGMDDMAAAEYLYNSDWGIEGEKWPREREYAIEYANRVLAKDPTSLEALILKARGNVDAAESTHNFYVHPDDKRVDAARLLIQHYPDNERAVSVAVDNLYRNFPEETISAISRLLPEDGLHPNSRFHFTLGNSYERLDMIYEAADQFQKAFAAGDKVASYRYSLLERGEPAFPSIWEERAVAEAAKQAPPPAEASAPHSPPDVPASPDAPRGMEPPPPPPNLEAEMSAAYADFAKAYQDAFEMEYGLSEATPEGYMNALLGMARAFAKAGDAQHAQDAYNAVRKRHSREEVEQVFRRFDEQERLKRQPPNEEENDDNGEDE